MSVLSRQAELKKKIRARKSALGLFVKTPSMHIVEVLASAQLDFIVLDTEHAPFSPESLDQCLLAARANNLPALVRVADPSGAEILRALDMGAAGVFVPHIKSADDALNAVAATRYKKGVRGFSASHRAGSYGAMPAKQFIEESDQSTIVIGQIEDVEAINNIDEIAAIDALDALFIGPADLSVFYGVDDWSDPLIDQAIDKVCQSAQQVDKAVGLFQPTLGKVSHYQDKGISLFTIATDQSLLAKAARAVTEDFQTFCR